VQIVRAEGWGPRPPFRLPDKSVFPSYPIFRAQFEIYLRRGVSSYIFAHWTMVLYFFRTLEDLKIISRSCCGFYFHCLYGLQNAVVPYCYESDDGVFKECSWVCLMLFKAKAIQTSSAPFFCAPPVFLLDQTLILGGFPPGQKKSPT